MISSNFERRSNSRKKLSKRRASQQMLRRASLRPLKLPHLRRRLSQLRKKTLTTSGTWTLTRRRPKSPNKLLPQCRNQPGLSTLTSLAPMKQKRLKRKNRKPRSKLATLTLTRACLAMSLRTLRRSLISSTTSPMLRRREILSDRVSPRNSFSRVRRRSTMSCATSTTAQTARRSRLSRRT